MDLNYRKTGSGHPLIILHGLFGSSDNWFSIAKTLSGSYTVYCVDQRNHGRSPHSKEHNYDVLVEDLYQFIIKNDLKDPCIIGHSMGGKALIFFALKYPQFLKKMIVVDISPRSYKSLLEHEPHALEIMNIMNALLSVNIDALKSREDADLQLSALIKDKGLRAFLLKNLQRNENNTFRWCFNLEVLNKNLPKIMDGMDPEKNYPVCTTDTLFIKGERSDYILEKDKKMISQYFPNAIIESIKDAGHWLHAEKPAEFIGVVRKFLDGEK